MMREKFQSLVLAFADCAVAAVVGLWFASFSGCAAAGASAALSAAGPVAMTTTEGIAVANAQDKEPRYDKDEDKTMKCEQLAQNPPEVEEIRRTPELAIQTRELRIERTPESYRWVVYRSKGSSAEGWRVQTSLDKLHFNPPLQYLLPDKDSKFLAYAPATPESEEDGEKIMSIADDFGPKVGVFEWRGKHYTYTVSKALPCFPDPEE